ncbi:MAG: hypothetical protein ACREM2_09330 [Vulcanimicrobiaceae bacterium]
MNIFKRVGWLAALAVFALGAPAMAAMMSNSMDRYGGPVYAGSPNLDATAAFVRAGGGAANFNFENALVSMGGSKLITAEVAKLTKQYGKANVTSWVQVWNFAVPYAATEATNAGVKFPTPPSSLSGHALAAKLVALGTTKDGVYWTGLMLDHTITHKIHDDTMNAIDAKYGVAADANYHRITDQAMVDLAHALGVTSEKTAPFAAPVSS